MTTMTMMLFLAYCSQYTTRFTPPAWELLLTFLLPAHGLGCSVALS